MRNTVYFLFICCILHINNLQAQTEIPHLPLLDNFGGEHISDLNDFVPNVGDYTLEVQGTSGTEINIAFANIQYTPTTTTTIRFAQKDGKVYVFENGLFKSILIPSPAYTTTGNNLIQNPSFEDVESETLASGRWKPTIWDTWNGGMPTWGSEVGKTNVRETAEYRSDGFKSIIMHSETRQLLQELPLNVLEANEHYLLTYDYWTSSGSGNGGANYHIHLRNEKYTDGTSYFQNIIGHTTLQSGTEQSSFSTIFRAASDLPQTVYLVFLRNESKVDWLDNLKLYKLLPTNKGITGASAVIYLAGTAYAPENISFGGDDYIDMTGKIVNQGFDDGTNGWTINASGSKISTGEKAGGLIPGNQNHLQFWVGSNGINGEMYQEITDLPNGKYLVKAAIASSFSGNVSLYANKIKTIVNSGINQYYEATGTVFNKTLKIGLEMQTTGSPTIDIDDFKLYYLGIEVNAYLEILNTKTEEAEAYILAMDNPTNPGFNNLEQFRQALEYVENRADNEAETLIDAIAVLDSAIDEYKAILEAYSLLETAITSLESELNSSSYPHKTAFENIINAAQEIYRSKDDKRNVLSETIDALAEKQAILITYKNLQTAVADAVLMSTETNYPGITEFQSAINTAEGIIADPDGKDLSDAIKVLKKARAIYYDSQFTIQPERKVVSLVDTNLDNSEKFVLRIGEKPFYMTNIQVRLDKLYGYHGWTDAELEAVIKRAADDKFNTVSIPVFWREVEPEKDDFDWTILDKYMGWCKKYNIKMELLWFSWSSGGRVQYLMDYNGVQTPRTPDYVCSLDGQSEFNMLREEWEYSLDWRDTNLRDREKFVLAKTMEHVALWDANNENPQTVIGVQLGNEARSHGNNSATAAEIIDYYHHVGAAVKESKYVVWTRLNCVSYETTGRINANEAKRNSGGTNIDFVGIDIYGTSASSIKGDMNGQLPHTGKNYSMIMEIDAKDANSPLYQIAAIAGGKAFDYYNMGFVDGNGLYTNSGTTLVERDHIGLVRQRNKIINQANQDIALKAHDAGLYVYNYAGNSTNAETGLEGITFTPDVNNTQGVAIRHSDSEIVLLSTLSGTFSIPASLNVNYASVGYFNDENKWIKEKDIPFSGTTITMPETSAVLLRVEEDIKNPSFEKGTTVVNGLNVPVSWTLESSLSGADVKLSTASPAHGTYKYNIWASSVTAINLYQDIELPAGEYILTAAMRTGSQNDITNQHIYVQVGNEPQIKSEVLKYTDDPYWQTLKVEFSVSTDISTVRIGAASTGSGSSKGWFQIDDFRLENITYRIKDKCYTIKHVNGSENNLLLSKKENGEAGINPYSGIGQVFYVTQTDNDRYILEQLVSATRLTDGGSNSYNTSFVGYTSSNTSFNLVKEGEYYRLQGNAGYYATDNVSEGSAVYCDKSSTHANGLWLFEEITQDDAFAAAKEGLPFYISFAKEFFNEIEQQQEGSYLSTLYNNLNNSINTAESLVNSGNITNEAVFSSINDLRNSITSFNMTYKAYLPLKEAIEKFSTLLNASELKNDVNLVSAVNTAQSVYDHPEDQTANIQSAIDALNANLEPLWAYRALKTTITNAERMKDTNYGGEGAKNTFLYAISTARTTLGESSDALELRNAIQTLKDAVSTYLAGRAPEDWWFTIKNGALWKDDRGKTVQAHGAGFIQIGDTWYMIGEDRETAKWNPDINMYSSKDFVNWEFEGKIVENGKHSFTYSDGSVGTLGKNRMIERPKLLYCERTGQYVIWCHWEAGNYGASEVAVFYSDDITGPYTLHWAGRPLGVKSRDCNVFQDNDGKAYFVSTTNENRDLGVFELSEDYLDAIKHTAILTGKGREAPAIVRIGNQYNMLSSACSGWDPNQCQYTYSTSLTSGWSGLVNLNNKYSYDTQAASILTIAGLDNTSYLYVGDRWQDPDLAESKTIIFPIQFNGTSCTFNYSQQFDINLVTGETRASDISNRVPKNGWSIADYSSQQSGNEAARAIDGNTSTIWHTQWDNPKPVAPHHITVDMGTEYEVSGFLCTPRLDNDVNGLIRQFILYVSTDNSTWHVAAAGSWMPYGSEIYFPAVNARYFKLVSLSGEYASIAELDMLQDTGEYVATEILPYNKVGISDWETSQIMNAKPGLTVSLGPNVSLSQGSWLITVPNNSQIAKREVELTDISAENAGIYTAHFLNAYNQMSDIQYTLNIFTSPIASTWAPKDGSKDWLLASNWSDGVPTVATRVTIPNSSSYPVLTENTTVDEICFEAGAELGRQDLLTYQKAFVDYNFGKGNRSIHFRMLSLPLQEAFPGDFTFGGQPDTYIQTLQSDQNGRGKWVALSGGNSAALTSGAGFTLSLDPDKDADKGLGLSGGVLRLPFFDNNDVAPLVHPNHTYGEGISIFSNPYGEGSYSVTRSSKAYRLSGSKVTVNPDFGQSGNNIIALVGNPFMSTIDFSQLQAENNTLIKNNYQIWTKAGDQDGYAGYSPDGNWGLITTPDLDKLIAPLQGFVVERNGDSNGTLNFNLLNDAANESGILKSAVTSGNKIDIVAKNDKASVRTFIAEREGGSALFSERDVRKLINNLTQVPEIYTLKPSENGMIKVGANIIDAGDAEYPLGIATSYNGLITMTFSGMDSYNARIVLVDNELGKTIELTGLKNYDYTFSYEAPVKAGVVEATDNRFSLRLASATSSIIDELVETKTLTVYPQEGRIHVLSNGTGLKDLKIYNLNGAILHSKSQINSTSYVSTRSFNPGVYIVEVNTENGIERKKIIISNQ
ncbi:MAG: DUF4978 domain-containing protein [Prevotella sp.]|jgi:hypothetical protein|nr:DUF4978 domain-containing protein [Prevotella sp.]